MEKHVHHIIPKHMGGSDEPENLVELTVEQHAQAHKELYEKYGHWQDYLAYKGLQGLTSSDECTKMAIREGAKRGARISNKKRWGSGVKFRDDPDFIPYYKRMSGYSKEVDGRKVRSKRYWFTNGVIEGQFSLDDPPEGWTRGRLKRNISGLNVDF